MLKVLLLFVFLRCFAVVATSEISGRNKRDILNKGWLGFSRQHTRSCSQACSSNQWKPITFPSRNGWQLGKPGYASIGTAIKTLPPHVSKHVFLNKPVQYPVPLPKVNPYPVQQAQFVSTKHPVTVPFQHLQQPLQLPLPIKLPLPLPVPIMIPFYHPNIKQQIQQMLYRQGDKIGQNRPIGAGVFQYSPFNHGWIVLPHNYNPQPVRLSRDTDNKDNELDDE